MIIRSKDNRAWHDELFNTRVARVGSPLFGIIATITLFILFVFLISLIIGNFS
jgi:hypothetical protein